MRDQDLGPAPVVAADQGHKAETDVEAAGAVPSPDPSRGPSRPRSRDPGPGQNLARGLHEISLALGQDRGLPKKILHQEAGRGRAPRDPGLALVHAPETPVLRLRSLAGRMAKSEKMATTRETEADEMRTTEQSLASN